MRSRCACDHGGMHARVGCGGVRQAMEGKMVCVAMYCGVPCVRQGMAGKTVCVGQCDVI